MADRYLLESSPTDGYLLEDGSGVLLLDGDSAGTKRNLLLMGVGGWIVFFCLLNLWR